MVGLRMVDFRVWHIDMEKARIEPCGAADTYPRWTWRVAESSSPIWLRAAPQQEALGRALQSDSPGQSAIALKKEEKKNDNQEADEVQQTFDSEARDDDGERERNPLLPSPPSPIHVPSLHGTFLISSLQLGWVPQAPLSHVTRHRPRSLLPDSYMH